MSSSEQKEHVALVTGAAGFVATELLKQLFESGLYTSIRGSVRSADPNSTRAKHLHEQFPKLILVEADLTKPDGWDQATKGVHTLFHTASPFQITVADPVKDLIEPAVHGVEHVVNAAIRNHVHHIVLTSSVAAVRRSDKPADYVFSDKDWNETATIENAPYPRSKYLAEKKAWELIEAQTGDKKTSLVVINPSFVLGPPRSERVDGTSVSSIVGLLSGTRKGGVQASQIGLIDIRNVAQAHIAAAINEKAHGRYIVSSARSYTMLEVAAILAKAFPERAANLPTTFLNNAEAPPAINVDNSRAEKELGIKWIPIENTLKDMGDALIQLGLAK